MLSFSNLIRRRVPVPRSSSQRPQALPTQRNLLFLILWAIAAGVGTTMAIVWIPDDPQPPGALFGSACWLTAGLLAVPIIRAKSSAHEFLRVEHVVMLGLCYWLLLDLITGEYPLLGIGPDQVAASFIAISLFGFGIWVGVQGKGWSPPTFVRNASAYSLPASSLTMAIWICFSLGMLYYFYASDFDPVVMVNGLLVDQFSAPWAQSQIGGWDSFIINTLYFGYILPCLVVLLAQKKSWANPSVLIAILLTSIVIVFSAQSGSRRMVGLMLGAAFVCWVLLQPRFKPRLLIITSVIVGLLLGLFQIMLTYRGVGFEQLVEGQSVRERYGFLHVDDNFLRLAQVTELFPDVHPYVDFQPVIQALVRPVPRVFWSGKPVDQGYDLTELVGEKNVSLTQSIIGELYACKGFLAVFLGGLFFGRLGTLFNNVYNQDGGSGRAAIYGIGLLAIIATLRSMSEIFVYFYVLFGWIAIVKLMRKMRQRFRRAQPERLSVPLGR